MKYSTFSQSGLNPAQAATNRGGGDLLDFAGSILGTPFLWLSRVQDRRRLAELDDHMLRDIGLSRSEAEDAAATPFWRR